MWVVCACDMRVANRQGAPSISCKHLFCNVVVRGAWSDASSVFCKQRPTWAEAVAVTCASLT
jgi:hypothetical protein